MRTSDPVFAYLTILAVIQPARVQDIEASAKDVLGLQLGEWLLQDKRIRSAHDVARNSNLVYQVRRGVYFLAPAARLIVRRTGLERSIDNSRMFLMKDQRKRYR